MAKRPGMLDPLRVRVRRLQLIIGLGLIACVVGAVISIPISFRLLGNVNVSPWLFETLRTLISQLWAYAVLPVLLYGIARIIELKPWSAAIGSVVTGMVFEVSISLISRGFEGLTEEHPMRLVMLVVTAVAGVFLGALAVRSARAASKRAEDEARKAAEAKKDEYAAFAREAERLGARTEEREQAGGQGGAPAGSAAEPDASSTATEPGASAATGADVAGLGATGAAGGSGPATGASDAAPPSSGDHPTTGGKVGG